ncbi:MAG: hypothetical protein NVS1B2_11230 [Vulcanimicrobiaceae bacterium]
MPGLGDEFRAAREARHLSLSDVSEQIHIRSIYLEAIEGNDPSFAAPVYVRGFIRTYARYLGLDAEGAVATFNAMSSATPTKAHDSVKSAVPVSGSRPSPWLWLAAVAAVLLVAFVGYKYMEQRNDGAATLAVATPAASPVPSARAVVARARTQKAAARLTRSLEVRVTADSWLSVRVDGSPALEGLIKAGTTKSFHGSSVRVRAGNAGGVDLIANGKELGKMGNSGDVIERTVTLAEK